MEYSVYITLSKEQIRKLEEGIGVQIIYKDEDFLAEEEIDDDSLEYAIKTLIDIT